MITQERDSIKYRYLSDNGIGLIVVRHDVKDIASFLNNRIG